MSKYFAEQFRRDRLDENQVAQFLSSASFSRLSCNLPGVEQRGGDESKALADLRKAVAASDENLQAVLSKIADFACQFTGATGAAIAMWKDGAMICRARSDATAPPLGAQLSVESGISGACFSTGQAHNCVDTESDPLVDFEVCRRLGLRSIAALPIEGWRSINGILEVFSSEPFAFTEQNLSVLRQLAGLAEQARSARPHGATQLALRNSVVIEERRSASFLPASDSFLDLLSAFFGTRSRALLVAASVLAMCMVAFSMWLGWRGAKIVERRSSASVGSVDGREAVKQTSDTPVAPPPVEESKPVSQNESSVQQFRTEKISKQPGKSDLVWTPNPGGEALFISDGKPSAGVPVKFAAKVDRIKSKTVSKKSSATISRTSPASALSPSQSQ